MEFLQPQSIDELCQALSRMDEQGCAVAGCTDFLTKRNGKVWDASVLLSLSGVPELRNIVQRGQTLRIGALCTHTWVEEDALVGQFFPALRDACGNVGSKQIRNRGTLGGSIGNASPAGDIYPVLLALDASAQTINSTGMIRVIPAAELIAGIGKTALRRDEVITEFVLPIPDRNAVSAFAKLGERAKVTIAKINLAAALELQDGRITAARIVLGAVSEKAFFSARAQEFLMGRELNERTGELLGDILSKEIQRSISTRSSMPYKQAAVRGLAKDLIAMIQSRAVLKSGVTN